MDWRIGGDVRHASSRTARAESPLAAEGDQALEAALRATHAREAPREQTTGEVTPELALDEDGIAVAVALASLFQERLEVVADGGVENGLLGLAAAVARASGALAAPAWRSY